MIDRSLLPSATEVREAARHLAGVVRHTPLVPSPALSRVVGGECFLKLESEQHGGSFKLRGAYNAVHSLRPDQRARGVVASSAGNHGLGIAMAARALHTEATVFVPTSAPAIKRDRIAAAGAKVDATAATYDDAEVAARAHARATGATFISPCTGRALLAGQGTVALEIAEDLPTVATIVAAVGGGGLVGGLAGYIRGALNGVRLLGAQSVATNAMSLAFEQRRPVTVPDLPTLADGLAGLVDETMYAQGRAALDVIITVDEEAIAEAIRWLHREHGVTAEGAGACAVAALLTRRLAPRAFPVVAIVSGGNIDPAKHASLVQ